MNVGLYLLFLLFLTMYITTLDPMVHTDGYRVLNLTTGEYEPIQDPQNYFSVSACFPGVHVAISWKLLMFNTEQGAFVEVAKSKVALNTNMYANTCFFIYSYTHTGNQVRTRGNLCGKRDDKNWNFVCT